MNTTAEHSIAHTNKSCDSEPPTQPDSVKSNNNDPDELHHLVSNYSEAVYRLAYSMTKDRSLAEDISQETMVKAWLALPTFRGDASLKNWVLRIAHNTTISVLRSRKAVLVDPADIIDTNPTATGSVEQKVQHGVAVEEFLDALNLLDDLSRSIIVLRELEGLSYEEITDVLQVPMPTVKTRLLRARRRLSVALKEWA